MPNWVGATFWPRARAVAWLMGEAVRLVVQQYLKRGSGTRRPYYARNWAGGSLVLRFLLAHWFPG